MNHAKRRKEDEKREKRQSRYQFMAENKRMGRKLPSKLEDYTGTSRIIGKDAIQIITIKSIMHASNNKLLYLCVYL